MGNIRVEAIDLDAQLDAEIDRIARMLWENGEMLVEQEGGLPYTWDEICADNLSFSKRHEVEAYAKALIASGFTDAAQQMREALELALGQFEFYVQQHMKKSPPDHGKAQTNQVMVDAMKIAIAAYDALQQTGAKEQK